MTLWWILAGFWVDTTWIYNLEAQSGRYCQQSADIGAALSCVLVDLLLVAMVAILLYQGDQATGIWVDCGWKLISRLLLAIGSSKLLAT